MSLFSPQRESVGLPRLRSEDARRTKNRSSLIVVIEEKSPCHRPILNDAELAMNNWLSIGQRKEKNNNRIRDGYAHFANLPSLKQICDLSTTTPWVEGERKQSERKTRVEIMDHRFMKFMRKPGKYFLAQGQ